MRIFFFTGLFCYFFLAGIYSYSQELSSAHVPNEVIQAFTKEFPGTSIIQWKKIKGNIYCASFSNGKGNYAVYFDWLGILLQLEILLQEDEIPASILTYLKQHYPLLSVSSAKKLHRGNGLEYVVLLQNGGKSVHELLFDEVGNFIIELELRVLEITSKQKE